MPCKGIIFDLDGTLVDSFPAIHQSLSRAMERVGVPPWPLQQTLRSVGRGADALLETAVGPEKKARALALFKEDYRVTCLEKTSLYPGVIEGLTALQRSGRALAVASNKPLAFTRIILEHLGVAAFFDSVAGPEQVEHPKPHPAMIRAILQALRLAPDECIYVGDMPLDLETASRAEVHCVLVATGAHSAEELRRQAAVPVLRSLAELPALLKGR